MRIQHNIMAMNAYRNYSNNTSALSKNLEKLSSGYKINRAGDDAAGLAISEKMRAQITGLDVAQKNAKDGISLVQTAEGALTEVHDMLNRMVELANQSANGTYDETDRIQLQKEITQLQDEIDRIADSANFNGIKLLDGSLSEASTESTATQLMDIGVTLAAGNASAGRVDAEAAGHVFNVEDTAAVSDTAYDAFKITFKNDKGETKSITLVEGAVDGITASDSTTLAGALSGANTGLSLTLADGSAEDLAEFRELFDITGGQIAGAASPDKQGLKIQAKNADSGAELVSLEFASDADADTAIAGLASVAEDATHSTKAESAGYAIDLDTTTTDGTGNNVAAGDTIKIGDTVYEFVTNSGDKPTTSGATAVVLGADDAGTTQNLVAQLKKDGYEVSVSQNDKSKLIFTDMSKISEKQGGAQISASSDDVLLTKQEAAKQVTEITIAGTTNATAQTFTFNYVDENGKAQSKTLSYTPATGDAAGNATAIYNALKDDADLVKLFDIADDGAGKITITARGTGDGAGAFQGIVLDDTTATQTVTQTAGANEGKVLELKDGNNLKAGDTITVNGKTYEFTNDTSKPVGEGNIAISLGANANATLENLSDALSKDGVVHSLDKTGANYKLVFNDKDYTPADGGLTLQIGDTSEEFNQLTVSVKDCHAAALGLAGLDISTQDGAAAAVDVIKDAINYISDVRGTLGATQNRLDHTINNLSVMDENIQDAESSIRDTDVADEMMEYTKNNILIQSAQAMLAQANQVPQGVLQLLQ